ncbi:MAG: glycosyltransferase [Clostridia bacterium]|nr:glycosyltransferase [Clostridia bacterium]
MGWVARGIRYLRTYGADYTFMKIREKLTDRLFHPWDKAWRLQQADAAALEDQRKSLPAAGLISVLIPAYNTRPEFLEALLDALMAQTYPHWEACVQVTGTRADTRAAARRAAEKDPRIHCFMDAENAGISGNTNAAFRACSGGWVVLCDHDDLLPPDVLWHVADAIVQQQPDVIYTDEDKIDEKGRWHSAPHFKPDFCPDNLRSGNYVCHLLALRRSLYEAVGGERPAFDGSQDHDLMLRLSERTKRILHLPIIGYHWRTVGASMSHQQLERCLAASARAVEEQMDRQGTPGTVTVEDGILRLHYTLLPRSLGVLALMPNAGGAHDRQQALQSALPEDTPVRLVVPAEGQSVPEALNDAVAASREDLLLVLDAGITRLSPGFVRELAMYAQRDDVGMVTPLLTDSHGQVLFTGFTVHPDGTLSTPGTGLPARAPGPFLRNRQSRNTAAVSAACFMVRREAWLPLDPAMGSACAVPDACLRMMNNGLYHVYTPHAAAVCTNRSPLLSGNTVDSSLLQPFRDRWTGWHDPCAAFEKENGGTRR